MSNRLIKDDILMRARCKMITTKPWYGSIASLFKWKQTDSIPTMGVSLSNDGYVNCYYNEEFCNKLSIEQLMAIIQHEIEHIVLLHCVRIGSRNRLLWNIATDMAINGYKSRPKIDNLPNNGVFLDKKLFNNSNVTAEEIYTKLLDKCIIVNGEYINGGNYPSPDTDNVIVINGFHDSHSDWENSNIGDDDARQLVNDLVSQATIRAGSCPGHLCKYVEQLKKPFQNWKYLLKQMLGKHIGGKRKTWSRLNRRLQSFGTKGSSNRSYIKLTIGVDTSGSVSDDMLKQFFSELESISHKFKITLVQFDSIYQCHSAYRRGDWKKIKVKGRGGTSFINFFKSIEERKLIGQCNIVLTDGEAKWPEEKPYNVIWAILNNGRNQNITPPWGSVIHLDM